MYCRITSNDNRRSINEKNQKKWLLVIVIAIAVLFIIILFTDNEDSSNISQGDNNPASTQEGPEKLPTPELSSAKLSEAQIDTVEIYISHYASGIVEKTLTEKDMVNKYVVFFDGLDLQEKSEDVVVSKLDGGGWDCISFKGQDKIIKQYVIYGAEFICEEESLMNETLKMDVTTVEGYKEFAQKLDAHKWYVISDEDHIEWQAYKQELKQ